MFHVTDTFYVGDNRPYSRYPPSLYALNFMIDGINIMSHGFSGGKQMIIFANTSNTSSLFVYLLQVRQQFKSCKMYSLSFEKLLACCEDSYGRNCTFLY